MRLFIPTHLDAGNRGCQGITEGTTTILNVSPNNCFCYTTDYGLDTSLGLGSIGTLIPYIGIPFLWKIVKKIGVSLSRTQYRKRYISDIISHRPLLAKINKPDDLLLSTGGDMLCYSDNKVNTIQDYAKKHNIKTILWGCSMGKENLTEEKKKALESFDLIYTRESLSFEFFKELGLKNVVCLPDPAFVLKPVETVLPECFACGCGVLGLNLSNYVLGGFDLETNFGKQVRTLIDDVLRNTNLHILLIPHVTWAKQDDRKVCAKIKELYKDNDKVSILNIDSLNYRQIRYVISKCKFFIGGRTHAVISAYSTCVPAIALGYSVKSKGIAVDIGLDHRLVVDCKTKNASELVDSFMYLQENESQIKKNLISVIPDYSMKPFQILNIVNRL